MNDSMKKWLKAVGERTISTAAETALAVVVTILKNLVFQPSESKVVSK